MQEVPDFHLAPVSMTFASLVDALVRSKRMIVRLPEAPLEYNSMTIAADELGTFIHKYDKEMADGLSAFYDPDPYGHERRGGDIKIKIKSPQLNIFCGSTPSNLVEVLPEGAWGQGFTSRVVMVYSEEHIVGDDFAAITREPSGDLIHDIKIINTIVGEFSVTEDYRSIVNLWRQGGENLPPKPNHPRLVHYNARRRVNLYKLSIIAAVDRGGPLKLTRADFNKAMSWLIEAEHFMPDIFREGASGGDAQVIDEIYHFVLQSQSGVTEHKLVKFTHQRGVPAHSVMRVLEVMERSGMIRAAMMDKKTGMRIWQAVTSDQTGPGLGQ